MSKLIDRILENTPNDYFTDTELKTWIPGTPSIRYHLVTRALANGDFIQVRKGIYVLANRYQRHRIHTFELAALIWGPSYISFESALSYHNLIPEAVYSTTSASFKRSKKFDTPFGIFTYTSIPKAVFAVQVAKVDSFLMASPLKALADLVYYKKLDWVGVEPLSGSLRIEEDDFSLFKKDGLDELEQLYPSPRVRRFLNGIKKDLAL